MKEKQFSLNAIRHRWVNVGNVYEVSVRVQS